jgi:hypothetical protein
MMTSLIKKIGFYFAELLITTGAYSVLICYFASRGYIFSAYNREISWIILILFGTGVFIVAYHLWGLYKEDRELNRVDEQLESFQVAMHRLYQKRHTLSSEMLANTLRKTVDQYFAILDPSRIKSRIYRLLKMAVAGGSLDQETLSTLLQQEEEIKGGRVRYIAGILIMLGLLGTFLGLVQSVHHLQNFFIDKPNVDFNALFADMKQTLGGLDKAFGTSIGGITAYLVLGYLHIVLRAKQAYVLKQIENQTLEEFIPRFFQFRDNGSQNGSSLEVLETLQTIPVTLSQEIRTALEAIMRQTVDGGSENLKVTGEYLQQAAEGIQVGQQTFTETLTAFGDFFGAFQTGRDQLISSQETIASGIQKFSQALTHLEENQQMLTSSLEMTQDYIKMSETRLNAMDDVVQNMRSIWTDNRKVIEHLAETIRQEHTALTQTTEHLQDFVLTTKREFQEFFQQTQQHMQAPIDKNIEVYQQLLESHTLLTSLVHDMKQFLLDEQNGLRLLSSSFDDTFGEAKLQYLQLTDYVEELHKRTRENQEQLAFLHETTQSIHQHLQSRSSS